MREHSEETPPSHTTCASLPAYPKNAIDKTNQKVAYSFLKRGKTIILVCSRCTKSRRRVRIREVSEKKNKKATSIAPPNPKSARIRLRISPSIMPHVCLLCVVIWPPYPCVGRAVCRSDLGDFLALLACMHVCIYLCMFSVLQINACGVCSMHRCYRGWGTVG